jgi:hypothetical protein
MQRLRMTPKLNSAYPTRTISCSTRGVFVEREAFRQRLWSPNSKQNWLRSCST